MSGDQSGEFASGCWTLTTLGARDFSSAVSAFCQVFVVTRAKSFFSRGFGLRPTPKLHAAREKNFWYPG